MSARLAQCLVLARRARWYGAELDRETDMAHRIALGVVMAETLIERACLLYEYLDERRRRKLKGVISWSHHRW